MSQHDDFDRSLAWWLDAESRPTATADVLDRVLRTTRARRPRQRLVAVLGSDWVGDSVGPTSGGAALGRTGVRPMMVLLLLLLTLVLVAGGVLVGTPLLRPAAVDLGIFAPVADRIVYGDERGFWAMDPATPADPATRVLLTTEPGTPLAWSSDGTHLLIMRGRSPEANLFVLHADGSETRVTDRPIEFKGATILRDGPRVVFDGGNALYAVDVYGGPAEVLESAGGGVGEKMTFSPDGSRIAYTIGGGDHSNSVWVMDADGSDAHVIVSNETNEWSGHVRGLAWSPTGDRIALGLGGAIYTFAPDGSGFTRVINDGETECSGVDSCADYLSRYAESPYWSPDGSQIAYSAGCVDGAGRRGGCHLAIADADGSNVRTFDFPAGPWHPARMPSDEPSPVPLAADQLVLHLDSWHEVRDGDRIEVAVYADGRVIRGPDERGGYLEQWLTPEGVERLRSRALSTGLFERDLLALGTDVDGWGLIKVVRGDRPVIAAWGRTPEVDVSGHGSEDRWARASSAQAAEVTELDYFLRDPTTWGFTDEMYVQRGFTPFVPSHLWVSWDRGTPDWSQLPSPAREVVTRIMDRCGEQEEHISLDQAREIAQVLTQVGVRTDYDDRHGLSFSLPSSFVHAHPALPHDVGIVCGEG